MFIPAEVFPFLDRRLAAQNGYYMRNGLTIGGDAHVYTI